MDALSTEAAQSPQAQAAVSTDARAVGELSDQHCHLLLGEIKPETELHDAAAVAAYWQQDLVQQRVRALADSPVAHFALQTVDLADLKLHVALWPALERSPLGGRISLYAGLHPFYLKQANALEPWLDYVQALRANGSGAVVLAGIGEVGLDARTGLPLKEQIQLLSSLLEATAVWQLPYSFHCVKAHAELLGLLSVYTSVRGTVHGFNGSCALGLQYVRKGLKLGLGRALLAAQNERKFAQLLAALTPEQWCLESDFDGSRGQYDGTLLPALEQRVLALSGRKGVARGLEPPLL